MITMTPDAISAAERFFKFENPNATYCACGSSFSA